MIKARPHKPSADTAGRGAERRLGLGTTVRYLLGYRPSYQVTGADKLGRDHKPQPSKCARARLVARLASGIARTQLQDDRSKLDYGETEVNRGCMPNEHLKLLGPFGPSTEVRT